MIAARTAAGTADFVDPTSGGATKERVSKAPIRVWSAVCSVLIAIVFVGTTTDAGASCFGQCARGDRFTEMAAAMLTMPLVGLLAALTVRG